MTQQGSLPLSSGSIPTDKMREMKDSLKVFLESPGGGYFAHVMREQIEFHRNVVAVGAESIGDATHPMKFVLTQEFRKGVLQGLVVASRLPQLLIEQLAEELAKAAAKNEAH